MRTANVDDRFQAVTAAVGDMMDDVIRQVAVFGPNVKSQIQAALAAPKTVTPTVLEMTLTITLPEEVLQRFNDELARLSIEFGIPSD